MIGGWDYITGNIRSRSRRKQRIGIGRGRGRGRGRGKTKRKTHKKTLKKHTIRRR